MRAQPPCELIDNAIDVFVDVDILESNDAPATTSHEGLSPPIVFQLFVRPVRLAVNLNDQHASDMSKVCTIRANRMLAPEFETMPVCFAKPGPKNELSLGHFATHGFGM